MFIKKAAVLYKIGGIVEGNSYASIYALAHKLGISSGYILGYTDSSDNFIDHNQALIVAREAGQVPQDFEGPLYPEDIFHTGDKERAAD